MPALPPKPKTNPNWNSLTVPKYYQVKDGDTFASIGSKFNLPESDIQKLNNQLVAPPRGSYISLAPEKVYGPPAPTPQYGPTRAPYQPSVTPTMNNNNALATGNAYNPAFTNQGRRYTGGLAQTVQTYQNQFLQAQQHFDLTGQLNTKLMPQTMGLQVQAQLGMKAENMLALGYRYNASSGLWVQGNATQQPPQPAGQAGQGGGAGWVWERKKNGRWHKVLRGRNRRREIGKEEVAPVIPALASNAGLTPTTVLDVRLGSG